MRSKLANCVDLDLQSQESEHEFEPRLYEHNLKKTQDSQRSSVQEPMENLFAHAMEDDKDFETIRVLEGPSRPSA